MSISGPWEPTLGWDAAENRRFRDTIRGRSKAPVKGTHIVTTQYVEAHAKHTRALSTGASLQSCSKAGGFGGAPLSAELRRHRKQNRRFGAHVGPQTKRNQAQNARVGARKPAQTDFDRFRTGS